jgi:hypothetical protein
MTFVRDFAASVVVGMILLLLLSRLIGRVQFSLSTAFGVHWSFRAMVPLLPETQRAWEVASLNVKITIWKFRAGVLADLVERLNCMWGLREGSNPRPPSRQIY